MTRPCSTPGRTHGRRSCRLAELVHETIAVLSFLPIAAGVRFGAYPVFIITSVLAAACDMAFVIMQRYNRPRLIKLMELQKRKAPTGE